MQPVINFAVSQKTPRSGLEAKIPPEKKYYAAQKYPYGESRAAGSQCAVLAMTAGQGAT
jgi:hypothetical protein